MIHQSRIHDMTATQILKPDGTLARKQAPDVPEEALKRMFETLLLVRTLDQRMLNLQRQGRIGFYGTARGEEAAVIGSAAAVEDSDWIFPALRQGGAALYRGYALDLQLALGRLPYCALPLGFCCEAVADQVSVRARV